jgi:phosphoglycerate dehydrogenase-like enzyme
LVVAGQEAGLIGQELSSQTVGVIGWGDIGQRVGHLVKALGATVVAHDPFRKASEIRADGVEVAVDLDQLLRWADIVTIHVPLSPGTKHLIGAWELETMRPGACLINTSRGGVVDEYALADAVSRRHLRAAAIDVFASEPPPPDHPLLAVGAVMCTPHMAGSTSESLLRMGMSAARAVVDVLSGGCPEHLVNPAVAGR